MKSLKNYIDEKLSINKNYNNPYNYSPKSFEELREIIEQRYKEQGPGTKQKPIEFNDIDISNINSFCNRNKGIFEKTKFEYIDISDWDVSNVQDMKYMFYECNTLESIGDISNWNVSNVENMHHMFYGCNNLKSVGDLSNWTASKVENMKDMFFACKQLTSVGDLSKWDVSGVKDVSYMFDGSGITNTPSWYKK